MPKNGNGWNSSREGTISEWSDRDNRYGKNRHPNYESDTNWRNDDNDSDSKRRQDNNINQQNSSYSTGQTGRGNTNRMSDYDRNNDYGNRSYYGDRMDRGSSMSSDMGNDWRYRNTGNFSDRNTNWNSRGFAGDTGSYNERFTDRYNMDRDERNERSWWDKTKDEVSSWFGDDSAERRRRMDNSGLHRGKGPKGYTRSDERIKEDVNDRLSDDAHIDASEIDVTVSNCEVTLSGTVTSRWEKRHAEDLAESISGVKNVENRIRVQANSGSNSNSQSGTSSYGSTGSNYSS